MNLGDGGARTSVSRVRVNGTLVRDTAAAAWCIAHYIHTCAQFVLPQKLMMSLSRSAMLQNDLQRSRTHKKLRADLDPIDGAMGSAGRGVLVRNAGRVVRMPSGTTPDPR